MSVARESIEKEPQINADERRLSASSEENIRAEASENYHEWHLNPWRKIGIDENQLGILWKSLISITNKSNTTNLRLSAFICGLNKSQKTRQQNFILELENQGLLFVKLMSAFKNVHPRRNLR